MGGFLDKPKTEKSRECNEGNGLRYGVVSMQGWRVEMEDSHTAVVGLPGGFKGIMNVRSLFASMVFQFLINFVSMLDFMLNSMGSKHAPEKV